MKKLIVTFVLLFASVSLFATNLQKIWPTNDPVYDDIEFLYIQNGLCLPSSSGPWSTAELIRMVEKLPEDSTNQVLNRVKEKLYSQPDPSNKKVFEMSMDLDLSFAAYAHTNTEFDFPFDEANNYIFRINNKIATADIKWESWVRDSFYGYFSYQMENQDNFGTKLFDEYNFNFDLAFACPEGYNIHLDTAMPNRAFVSAGSDYWNIEFGRDRLVLGSGVTGNLAISDNFRYHNLLKFSAFGEDFKFSFIMSFFPHPVNVKRESSILFKDVMSYINSNSRKGIFFYMAHRAEGALLKNKLSLAFTESIVYQSEEGIIDPQYLNPIGFFHNYFIGENSNSLVTIEASYGLAPHYVLYGQFCLDDFSMISERAGGDDRPNALGFLLGLKNSFVVNDGTLLSAIESVYTLPYTYLRSIDSSNQNPDEYDLDYIGYFRSMDDSGYVPKYLGYTYGGDSLVLAFKSDYKVPEKYSMGTQLLLMLHGDKTINSLYKTGDFSLAPSGTVNFTSIFELKGTYTFAPRYEVFGQYDWVFSNKQHDHQFVLGVNVDL